MQSPKLSPIKNKRILQKSLCISRAQPIFYGFQICNKYEDHQMTQQFSTEQSRQQLVSNQDIHQDKPDELLRLFDSQSDYEFSIENNELCYDFHQKGYCQKGQGCTFVHKSAGCQKLNEGKKLLWILQQMPEIVFARSFRQYSFLQQ